MTSDLYDHMDQATFEEVKIKSIFFREIFSLNKNTDLVIFPPKQRWPYLIQSWGLSSGSQTADGRTAFISQADVWTSLNLQTGRLCGHVCRMSKSLEGSELTMDPAHNEPPTKSPLPWFKYPQFIGIWVLVIQPHHDTETWSTEGYTLGSLVHMCSKLGW